MTGRRDADFTSYVVARLGTLRRIGYLLCQDWQRADDLVQAAITRLYMHWDRAAAVEHTDAYARTILVREFVAGQSRYVRLDGVQAVLRTIDEPGKHVQYLCARDIRGMQIYLSLDLSNPDTNDTPLPGGHAVADLLTVFKHLRLLGPHVAHWTTNPVG